MMEKERRTPPETGAWAPFIIAVFTYVIDTQFRREEGIVTM
jgi:hypothetical protein